MRYAYCLEFPVLGSVGLEVLLGERSEIRCRGHRLGKLLIYVGHDKQVPDGLLNRGLGRRPFIDPELARLTLHSPINENS